MGRIENNFWFYSNISLRYVSDTTYHYTTDTLAYYLIGTTEHSLEKGANMGWALGFQTTISNH